MGGKMKKLFDDDDDEHFGFEKSRILVTVVPFVLIIIILAITLIVNNLKKSDKGPDGGSDDLQQSIMDYADENKGAEDADSSVPVSAGFMETEEHGQDEGSDSEESDEQESASPKKTPSEKNSAPPASPTPVREAMKSGKKDYSKIEFHKDEQLRDMMAYWADNNQKAINDLVYLDHYVAMSYSLKGTNNFY